MRRRTTNPVVGAVVFVLFSFGFLLLFGILGAVRANTYYNGDAVTAHVTYCETHRVYSKHGSHDETTCYGSWTTADGQHHSGEIDGAERSDDGTNIRIRALGSDAIVDSPFELWPLAVATVALILTPVSIVMLRNTLRRRNAMRYGPSAPNAGPYAQPYVAPGQQPRYRPPGS